MVDQIKSRYRSMWQWMTGDALTYDATSVVDPTVAVRSESNRAMRTHKTAVGSATAVAPLPAIDGR